MRDTLKKQLLFRWLPWTLWATGWLYAGSGLGQPAHFADATIPIMSVHPSTQCTGTQFYNINGELVEGTRPCEADAPDVAGRVLEGQSVGAIRGTLPICQTDGQTDCYITGDFRAVDPSRVPALVLSGVSVGGAGGTVTLPLNPQVVDGVSYGPGGSLRGSATELNNRSLCNEGLVIDCITSSQFASMAVAGVSASVTDLQGGTRFATTLTGTVGSLEFWDSTGTRYSIQSLNTLVASGVREGENIFEIVGIGIPDPIDCSSSLRTDCFVEASNASGFFAGPLCRVEDLSSVPLSGCFLDPAGSLQASTGLADLIPENIRRGVTIASVTGVFPSTQAPMPTYVSDSKWVTTAIQLSDAELTDVTTQFSSDANFKYVSATGLVTTSQGDDDLVAENLASGITLPQLVNPGTVLPYDPVPSFVAEDSGSDINLVWGGVQAHRFMVVAGPEGSEPVFVPQQGQSYTTGSQGPDEILYVGTASSMTHGSLPDGTYYYAVYRVSVDHFYSAGATASSSVSGGGGGGGD